MPYINKMVRRHLLEDSSRVPCGPGELNFLITTIVHNYINKYGPDYQSYNDAIGALECAKLELYRRKVVPYEDKKIEENGDV